MLGFLGLAMVFVLAIANFDLVTGSPAPWIRALPYLLVPVFLGGIVYAAWLRRARPAVYRGLTASIAAITRAAAAEHPGTP
jgi:hypothetical protein